MGGEVISRWALAPVTASDDSYETGANARRLIGLLIPNLISFPELRWPPRRAIASHEPDLTVVGEWEVNSSADGR